MIYLDNSATTPLSPEVMDAMRPYFEKEFGNASSVYTLGNRARVALEEARETIARFINAEPREIIFTSGGTEANNAAIKGPLFHKFLKGVPWSEMSVVTSPAEHHSVLHPIEFMGKMGVERDYAEVDATGHVLEPSIMGLVDEKTALVSMMYVNNEVGAINRIAEITRDIRGKFGKCLFHTDAVQALGKIKVDVRALDVDLLSLSAHKVHGPKGIGVLYAKSGIEWEPLLHGGAQERNRRGGTEQVALAVGFAKAVELISEGNAEVAELRKYLISKLIEIPEVVLNSATDDSCVDAIVNFSFTPEVLKHFDADSLLIRFDLEGIAISNGSACTSGSQQPSHVLMAMGKGDQVASKSIRVSMSRYTKKSDIDQFIETLLRIIPR